MPATTNALAPQGRPYRIVYNSAASRGQIAAVHLQRMRVQTLGQAG